MFKDYGEKQITLGFSVICLLFSIPIIFLFYFMIGFKNSSISFVKEEIEGIYKIQDILKKIQVDDSLDVVDEIRKTGNETKLILDSDLDSYYIMHSAVVSLPRIYSDINKISETGQDLEEEKNIALRILIRENAEELLMAINVARENDKTFYGFNRSLQSHRFELMTKEIVGELVTEQYLKNKSSTKRNVITFWWKTLEVLKSVLDNRLERLIYEKNEAIAITAVSWVLSFVLVIYFSRVILNRQKSLYERIQTQNIKLASSSKMSALGEMAGGIAHEINTPLSTILMRTEQLQISLEQNAIDKKEFEEALNSIEVTVQRISKIVLGLRSFARDGSRDPLEICSIDKIILDTLQLCQERLKNYEIKLDYRGGAEYKVLCRPIELSQVLLNLLNNSFDAVMVLPEKWIKINLDVTSNSDLILSVIDSGKGISVDLQNKIMQPFFTTKETGKGTGLGLSISQGLITSQGGVLHLDTSCANTKFDITLKIV